MPHGFDFNLKTKLMWCTRGHNCPMCNAFAGRVYSFDYWMSSCVWPGFHINCDCYLKKVDYYTKTSDPDFFGAALNLYGDDWFSHLFDMMAYVQLDTAWENYAVYSMHQIEEAHLRYGAHLPIGEVIKRMKDDFQGFFKRSTILNQLSQWRLFSTTMHYQNIDDTFSGSQIPWLGGFHNDLSGMWKESGGYILNLDWVKNISIKGWWQHVTSTKANYPSGAISDARFYVFDKNPFKNWFNFKSNQKKLEAEDFNVWSPKHTVNDYLHW